MTTFLIGLFVLFIGGGLYGKVCENIIRPTDKPTPAISKADGVDFVAMSTWKNRLIQLLNIAGTGPILGPIQGILFGPIAFITIPIGCVLGGALHDYMTGMMSVREGGAQMPGMIKKYLGNRIKVVYSAVLCLLLFLVIAVFVYTPGDLVYGSILKKTGGISDPVLWIIYGVIILYYLIASVFPIDKLIGRIYPIFGGILLLSAVGVFIGIFTNNYQLTDLGNAGLFAGVLPEGQRFIPIFFVTVSCGICSGFHATQCTLISRTIKHEKEGRGTFYNMMILEGFIAMIWAGAAMGAINKGIMDASTSAVSAVGIIASDLLGSVGSIVAILGVVVLAVTTGDTALRATRLTLSELLRIPQATKKSRLLLTVILTAIITVILYFAKSDPNGFQILWRYFAWGNQLVATFAFCTIASWLLREKKPWLMALIPGAFYIFIVLSFILNAKIGFGIAWTPSYIIAGVLTVALCVLTVLHARKEIKK